MKPTLTDIKAATILQALRKAKPITVNGRIAVENYKAWLLSNGMTAVALENSIISLTGTQRDAGLESLIATLKGLLPESKRKVAIAYEMLQYAPKTLLSAPETALEALSKLYEHDASSIIDSINTGALDAFSNNPVVAKLISWAKNASKTAADMPIKTNASGSVVSTIIPVLYLAQLTDDNMLIAVDGKLFVRTSKGGLSAVTDVSEFSEDTVSSAVKVLVQCLSQLQCSSTEPNLLVLKPEVLEYVAKLLPIQSFAIDLLGGVNELVQINGQAMSKDKAIALFKSAESEMLASILMSDSAKDALTLIASIMDSFEIFRGVIGGSEYANKFVHTTNSATTTAYILEYKGSVADIIYMNSTLIELKLYSSIFDVLTSEIFVSTPNLHSAVSAVFASELKEDAKKLSIRKRIAIQLSDERKSYEALLDRINSELDNLAAVVDANPEKADALKAVKTKTEAALATVVDEIDKLSK